MKKTLQELVNERVLLLDGATGTMVQQYGIATGNNDIISLTHPEVVEDIHTRYLRAGADIIETCTFNAQRISLADCGATDQVRAINLAAASIARRCADAFSTPERPRFVAGSVGPTGKTLSMSPSVEDPAFRALTFDELETAYEEQMVALLEGGVDALLIETIFDTLNAKAAVCAATAAMQQMGRTVPVMLSVTLSDNAGRTLSGQTLEAFLASVSTYDIFSVGLNCSFGAAQMKPFIRSLSQKAPCYVSCYPNAGLPNALGAYDTTPDEWASLVGTWLDEGLVNIVGGCCGTTDEYIAALRPYVDRTALRRLKDDRLSGTALPMLQLSGLEPLYSALPSPTSADLATDGATFVNVGERCNVAGSRKFLRLINEKNYDEAITIARRQVEDGALMLDINMDDGLLDTRAEMTHFLHLLAAEPDIARVPFMIDSSNWEVITAAIKCTQGKSVVNSISLKEGEEIFLAHARELSRLGAAVVVMAFDEQGQADTYERKIAVCSRAYHLLVEQAGMNPSDIIFDPNILAVATGMPEHDAYAVDFIRATRWIRANLPGAHVSGGVSNLSFAFRGNNRLRESMHAVFLYHAIRAGMDMAIVNPSASVQYADIPAEELERIEDVILNRRPDAAARLTELASRQAAETANGVAASVRASHATVQQRTLDERLADALLRGDGSTLTADLQEALAAYPSPVAIIEGPLMAGMNTVGEYFGAGKMFLPQVVKAARTMKEAVAILQPAIDAMQGADTAAEDVSTGASRKPVVLLATVKGDVHDIGKNIVSVVMACNGFEMVDMGVMVPAEAIVAKAREVKPDIIGLSGLITPSLTEMVGVAEQLQAAGLRIPLMIGGATTSEMHTALKIAPVYDAPVVHVKDASQNARIANLLLATATAPDFVATLRERQETLRQQFAARQQDMLSLDEARHRKPNFFDV